MRQRIAWVRARLAGETGRASAWMYAGRGIGLVWALFVTDRLGISQYGHYAVAIAASALIALPIDHYFVVRTPRESDEVFARDRVTRLLAGTTLAVIGTIAVPFTFVIGFAVAKAGGEVAFNAVKSGPIRSGRPARSFRTDTTRQLLCAVVTAAYVVLAPHPRLTWIALLTMASFVPFLVGLLVASRRVRPAAPELSTRTLYLAAESVGAASYQQLDIVMVGWLAGHAAAGYYAYASLAVWALAAVGQNFSFTYHEPLRAAGGDDSAGPPLRASVVLSAATGVLVALVAVALAVLGAPHRVVLTFALMAPVTALCTLCSVFTTVLAIQGRDRFRTATTWLAVALKTALIVVLGGGSAAAALAFLAASFAMTAAYGVASHRTPTGEVGLA